MVLIWVRRSPLERHAEFLLGLIAERPELTTNACSTRRVSDRRLLALVRRMLTAGVVMPDGQRPPSPRKLCR